jgi:type II secretory pathway component PulK
MYCGALSTDHGQSANGRKGVVLLIVLVVIVMLSLAAYQYSGWMTSEYKADRTEMRQAQARALATSGINYVMAMLANPSTYANNLSYNPYNNPLFQEQGSPESGPGRFSIVAPIDPSDPNYGPGARAYRFGAVDESGKININALLQLDPTGNIAKQILMALPNPTNADLDSISDAILDWLDPDENPRTNGAESNYYSSLNPPYYCKNGPLDSFEELLLVKGVTPQLLFGNDRNRNGIIDPDEDDGTDPSLQLGWSAYLTVYSREQDFDSQNNPRTYLNNSSLDPTTLATGLGQDLATYIGNYKQYGGSAVTATAGRGTRTAPRGPMAPMARATMAASGRGTQIASLYDLIDSQVTVPGSSSPTPSPLSSKNIDSLNQYLPPLLDTTTVTRPGQTTAPRINVLTASPVVLQMLMLVNPTITSDNIQAIISNRPSLSATGPIDPIYLTTTWLITKANWTVAKVKAVEKWITSRSQVYRVQSIGYFPKGGPTARIEAIIDVNGGMPRLISWRDLTELGKGIDLQTSQ